MSGWRIKRRTFMAGLSGAAAWSMTTRAQQQPSPNSRSNVTGDVFTPAGGPRLTEFLDALPVTTRWLHHHRVVWQTGQQNAPEGTGPMAHTHCSAFVAAAALMLDIYLLRPPFHSQELLANAQADWLAGTGNHRGPTAADSGWTALGVTSDSAALTRAVTAAGAGQLVVAIFKAPPVTDNQGVVRQRPGHVCIVRPPGAPPPPDDGPDVISVGDVNRPRTSMRTAFHAHPGAWPNAIQLYVHRTDLEQDAS